MAKGGFRPGGGRPKGSKNKRTLAIETMAASGQVVSERVIPIGDASPLEFMLSVMCDPQLPTLTRFQAAVAAAPYCHPRLDRVTQSKKDEAAKDAKDAGTGKFATPLPPKLIVNNR